MSASFFGKVDVSELRKALEDESLFGEFSYRKDSYAHSGMDDIWVRYNHASKIGAGFNDEHSSVWYPVIDKIPEILPVCMKIMSAAQGERLGGVLITKLAPGKRIEPHVDRGWHAEYYQKYFVPIKNGKGAKFCWEDIEIDPRPGEVWEFDNSVTHWVENSSSEDRIAMIVCVKKVGSSLDECRREV